MYDVVIVGGGAAGLSAALTLGRARRSVLVCSAGAPRNAPAHAAHGLFTRDGTPPAELLRIGREQLLPYPTVELRELAACEVTGAAGSFAVALADGRTERARRVLFATGVIDELPDVPGMRELWGSGVFHCPYCHGWEVRDQPLAVYGRDAGALHLALLLPQWSADVVLLTDGPVPFDEEQRRQLARRGVGVRPEPLQRLKGRDGRLERIVFAAGEDLARSALFVRPPQRQRSALPARLGCVVQDGFVQVDEFGRTVVPGVYAAGDLTGPYQQLVAAAAAGARAAATINGHDLLREEAA
jgi:thioredoxin reductase